MNSSMALTLQNKLGLSVKGGVTRKASGNEFPESESGSAIGIPAGRGPPPAPAGRGAPRPPSGRGPPAPPSVRGPPGARGPPAAPRGRGAPGAARPRAQANDSGPKPARPKGVVRARGPIAPTLTLAEQLQQQQQKLKTAPKKFESK
jgi:hypothetical protein